MSVVVVAEHMKGELADITLEMLACGRDLARGLGGGVTCVVLTDDPKPFQGLPLAADRVIVVQDPVLGAFNPEAYVRVLAHLLKDLAPRVVLLGSTSVGMDLAGPLSVALGAAVVGNCTKVLVEAGRPVFLSRLYGGKLTARSEGGEGTAIVLLMAGGYPKEGGMRDGIPPMEVRPVPAPLVGLRTQFKEMVEPAGADVDLTKTPILVGAGRGIQGQENLEMIEELAKVLGGAVCATRPVVDQGWLPRTRQVGRSGVIVKPRLYIALGISGAPEHVEGMRDADLIVAVNTDAGAPIFEVAHVGTTLDLTDLVPALTEKVRELKGGA